jgi:hypothetical protein
LKIPFRDILYELASVGDLPLPQPSPPSNKRERDAESPVPFSTPPSHTLPPPNDALRRIAGSRRVSKDLPMSMPPPPLPQLVHRHHTPPQPQDLMPLYSESPAEPLHQPPLSPRQYFALPMYSNELAGLPLHGKVSFLPGEQPLSNQNLWYPPIARSSTSRSTTASGTPAPNLSSSMYGHRDSDVTQISTMTQGYSAGDRKGGGMMDMTESAAIFEELAALSYASGGAQAGAGLFSGPVGGAMPLEGMYGGQLSGSGHSQQESQIRFSDVFPQHQQQEQLSMQYPTVDPDMMVMWSTAPTGFE